MNVGSNVLLIEILYHVAGLIKTQEINNLCVLGNYSNSQHSPGPFSHISNKNLYREKINQPTELPERHTWNCRIQKSLPKFE